MISEPTSELVSGGVKVGTSLIAGILNYWAQEEANYLNAENNRQERLDNLAAQRSAERLANRNLALNTRQQAFTEAEAGRNRGERAEERGYGRMMSSYQRGADLLTQNMNLLQAKAAPFQKYAAGR